MGQNVNPAAAIAGANAAAIGTAPPLAATAVPARVRLVDALRALASQLIAWHHFTLYPPLATEAAPIAGGLLGWVRDHARAAQVFFVVSGYVLAAAMAHLTWDGRRAGRYIIHRYCRLGLPYLAAIACAVAASAWGRDWLPAGVVGAPPTWRQVLAHVFFLQDILGYESLSAGLWFVCISFQLTLLYLVALYVRDSIGNRSGSVLRRRLAELPRIAGWLLALASLFYFNRDDRWDDWAVYFFGQFFLGILVHRALVNPKAQFGLGVYAVAIVAAMAFDWRARLLTTLATGGVLLAGGKLGFASSWPQSRAIALLGRTSYSFFLIHFPVLLVVATLWERYGLDSPVEALLGLATAYLASLAAAVVFYRVVESPAARLSRRFN